MRGSAAKTTPSGVHVNHHQNCVALFRLLPANKATRRSPLLTTRLVNREVRRRTRPIGVFSDRTSLDRIPFAVFHHENQNQGVSTPLLLTQTF